jgi:hypothetical protein
MRVRIWFSGEAGAETVVGEGRVACCIGGVEVIISGVAEIPVTVGGELAGVL